ncbi:hypothetical protein J4423_02975 [Candidatus Pacearchaeota archaeon]|nr:hypothetical protein [Candidatus Pacearchaeota archaeon]
MVWRNKLLASSLGLLGLSVIYATYILSNRGPTREETSRNLEKTLLEYEPSRDLKIENYLKNGNLESLAQFLRSADAPSPLINGEATLDLKNSPQFLYVLMSKEDRHYLAFCGSCNVITEDGFVVSSEHVIRPVIDNKGAKLVFFDPVRNIVTTKTDIMTYSQRHDFALLHADIPFNTYKTLSLAPTEQVWPELSSAVVLADIESLVDEFKEVIEMNMENKLKEREISRVIWVAGPTSNKLYNVNDKLATRKFNTYYYLTDEKGNRLSIQQGNSGSGTYSQDGFYQGPLSMKFDKENNIFVDQEVQMFVPPTVVRSIIQTYISRKK